MDIMKKISFIRLFSSALLVIGVLASGCEKHFLAKDPSTNLLVPTTATDFQELLDNTLVMNITPELGEVSADNYYLTFFEWNAMNTKDYNAYIWAPDLYEGQGLVADWDNPYSQVFYANVVLQGLGNGATDTISTAQWNMLEGEALFTRSYAFFNIAELFAMPYDSLTANGSFGIPIRTSPDITVLSRRTTLDSTYSQILGDLRRAAVLLPAILPVNNLNRPSRLAAQALLARIYLSVRDYTEAGLYADSVLQNDTTLVDYSGLDTSSFLPIREYNMPEVLYQSTFPVTGDVLQGFCTGCLIDTMLMASYDTNDLRRKVYYERTGVDSFILKGSYSGTLFPFSGLATDELYLIRAECYARVGQVALAMNDLNKLLAHRFRAGSFAGYTITDAGVALDTILVERRKELAFRGIRWSDLRRLNKEVGRAITLTRTIGGQTYTLPPNSNLYTLPIPPDVINDTHMQQNPR
jgi:starch-binding outer membrane protein, SusD/RagB family